MTSRLPRGDGTRSHGVAQSRWARPRGALTAALVAGAGLLAAAPASAEVVRLANGRAVSYQPMRGAELTASPFDKFFSNLDYNGGPVMASNTDYTVYWRPTGAPAYPSDYQPGVNRYFEDLANDSGGHENVDSVSTQFNDAAGEFANYSAHFGGALIDTDPYPANGCFHAPICLTDEQLREELVSYVQAHGLPHDAAHEYFLLTPPGVEDCFEEAGEKSECSAGTEPSVAEYCAYHSNIPLGGEGEIVYSNDPYVTGNFGCDDGNHPNGKTSDGVLEGGLSHEHNESITDPEPNNAWTDFGGVGGENGDKCRTFSPSSEFGTPLGEVTVEGKKYKYNQVINGHFYWYQQEWSNKGHACLQRLTFKAEEAPAATFTGLPVGGVNEVEFSASGSTAGAGVHYNWQFNDFFGSFPNKPVESETLTVLHKFPSAGTYTVALTVFKPDGTSIGTARTLTVGKTQTISFSSAPPARAAFNGPTYTAVATATSGLPVTLSIDASSSSVCAISGSIVSFIGGGTCTIDANQRGNFEYNPAPQVQQSFAVRGPSLAPPPVEPPPLPPIVHVPNSSFTALAATAKNGEITLRLSVNDPGTLSWLLTFQNGKFGVFAARASKCKKGFVRLNRRCRPAKIVYAKGSKTFASGGVVTFTIRPTRSATTALKNALKRKKGLPVTITLTFQSARGGTPVSQTRTLTVKLKKR